ncbi:polyamine-transporting ATPase 13A2-like isoform X2 [Symsagittifera roscoffensis]
MSLVSEAEFFSSDEQVNLVQERKDDSENKRRLKYFEHKHLRYIFNAEKLTFCKIKALDADLEVNWFITKTSFLTNDDVDYKLKLYGSNSTTVPVSSLWKIVFREIINPFYAFQIFSVLIWVLEEYYYYAVCILVISVVSLALSTYETRKQQMSLHKMSRAGSKVKVHRSDHQLPSVSGTTREEDGFQCSDAKMIHSSGLVPGDIVSITSNQDHSLLPFDAVLLSGSCVVNESMLTGESVPVTKCPLTADDGESSEDSACAATLFSVDSHKRHVLFSGTEVLQCRYGGKDGVKAVVIRTGFMTSKGELIRSILYPRAINFQFYSDTLKFVLVMSVLAVIGVVYTIIVLYTYGESAWEMFLLAADVVTICVPPQLPAALTVAAVYSQARLKASRIFCTTPSRINLAGRVNMVCYDKTGTITEDGMDVLGVLAYNGDSSLHTSVSPSVELPRLMTAASELRDQNFEDVLKGLAVTHSLSLKSNSKSGDKEIVGDPMEVKMFEFTGWEIHQSKEGLSMSDPADPKTSTGPKFEHVKVFPFVSELQRMSVIVKNVSEDEDLLSLNCKGSPEVIGSLCNVSTVPRNLPAILEKFGKKGFRLLALASKPLPANSNYTSMPRSQLETDLCFLGVLVMENRLKPDSASVIKYLDAVGIRQVMITGDNLSTAVSVAQKCSLINEEAKIVQVKISDLSCKKAIPSVEFKLLSSTSNNDDVLWQKSDDTKVSVPLEYHFAMDGQAYHVLYTHYPDLLNQILLRGTVFARMKPTQKSSLVQLLAKLGFTTCMCGDGSNDCGALRNADVGISLSEAEASIAAPFTSNYQSLQCVPAVIKEGRCSLATSFSLVKFMVLYSMIQFTSVVMLYSAKSNLTDMQYLYCDLVLCTSLALVVSRSGPSNHLASRRPPQSLVTLPNLVTMFLHVFLIVSVQFASFFIIRSFAWYYPALHASTNKELGLQEECFENTSLFVVSIFQYLIVAGILSRGPPHRAHILSNFVFVGIVAALTVANFTIFSQQVDFLNTAFGLLETEADFKFVAMGLLALYIFSSIGIESLGDWSYLRRVSRKTPSAHDLLTQTVSKHHYWPPIGEVVSKDKRGNISRSKIEDH